MRIQTCQICGEPVARDKELCDECVYERVGRKPRTHSLFEDLFYAVDQRIDDRVIGDMRKRITQLRTIQEGDSHDRMCRVQRLRTETEQGSSAHLRDDREG